MDLDGADWNDMEPDWNQLEPDGSRMKQMKIGSTRQNQLKLDNLINIIMLLFSVDDTVTMEFTNIGAVGQVGQPSMDGRPATAAAAPPAQVIIVQAPKMERSFEAYPVRPVFLFSAMQISLGALSIILGIANPLTCGFWGFVGFGIWGGVLVSLAFLND